MTRHIGTHTAEPGLYVNFRQLSFKSLEDEGPLPGTSADVYYRVPMVALFVMAPLVGLAYVIFLPLIGFGMVAYLLGGKALQFAGDAAGSAIRVLKPGWEPSFAFFSRSKQSKTKQAEPDAWTAEVEKKLDDETKK